MDEMKPITHYEWNRLGKPKGVPFVIMLSTDSIDITNKNVQDIIQENSKFLCDNLLKDYKDAFIFNPIKIHPVTLPVTTQAVVYKSQGHEFHITIYHYRNDMEICTRVLVMI